MHEKLENPFQVHPDWHHNACISDSLQYWELGYQYVCAADALVQETVDDTSLLDVYVSPLCYLYRLAVELFLKDLFWQSHFLAHGERKLPKMTHNLSELWKKLSADAQAVLGPAFPLSMQDTNLLKQLLVQIEDHDPRSDAFRFPFDAKGNRSHPSLRHVNVRSLSKNVHQAVDLLGNLKELVMDSYLAKSEKTVGQDAAPNVGTARASGSSKVTEWPSLVN